MSLTLSLAQAFPGLLNRVPLAQARQRGVAVELYPLVERYTRTRRRGVGELSPLLIEGRYDNVVLDEEDFSQL